MENMPGAIETYFDRLWPICRSITGNGLRESLNILGELLPLELTEVPTGTPVFDWEIPREWNIRDAYVITPDGKKICDFKVNNLHVLNYSIPVDREVTFEELDRHLHSIPEMPDAIPYLTSYYSEKWGFCISHREREQLPKAGKYTVKIDSTLEPGALTYAQCVLKGQTDREILFSTYVCHPSMANNELSGPLVAAFLYRVLAAMPERKYTYRFVFAPETIGVIAFLAQHGKALKDKLHAGYVITCAGDDGAFTYKRSKDPQSDADRIAEHVLQHSGHPFRVIDFAIGGSDERQYCSPGFRLPVGSLTRTMYQHYKEYHTSLDNKSFISFPAMAETVRIYAEIAKAHEGNRRYEGTVLYGEPCLGKRGLYPNLGGQRVRSAQLSQRLHILSFADGATTLFEMAQRGNYYLPDLAREAEVLRNGGLLVEKG